MREIAKKKWYDLSPAWNELYDGNTKATPFQSYEFQTFTGKGKAYRKDIFRLIGVKELNIVLYVNNKAVAIAPLLYKKKRKKTVVYLRGHFTAASQLDFIYENWSYEDFAFLMDGIRALLGNVSFLLDRVSEKTVTCKYLKQYFTTEQIEEYECFSIPIPQKYDDWYSGLRKSVRRNFVTHTNRIKGNMVSVSTDFFCGQNIDKKTCKSMINVYADRFIVKNNFTIVPLTKIIKRLLVAFLLRDKMTRWMNRVDNNFHAILYMNDEVAAFTSGVICKDKRIILSRLAIQTKFTRYGPGGALIRSAIEHIIEQNQSGHLDVNQLDLSQGGDGGMSYKKSYGGLVHYNYVFLD